MSDFETVALIITFLILSFIIVRLIGGDADRGGITNRGAVSSARGRADVSANGARQTLEPPVPRTPVPQQSTPPIAQQRSEPEPARVPPHVAPPVPAPAAPMDRVPTAATVVPRQVPDEAAVTVVTKPAPAAVEAAMVKLDLPPPTPITPAHVPAAPVQQTPVTQSSGSASSKAAAAAAAATAAAIARSAINQPASQSTTKPIEQAPVASIPATPAHAVAAPATAAASVPQAPVTPPPPVQATANAAPIAVQQAAPTAPAPAAVAKPAVPDTALPPVMETAAQPAVVAAEPAKAVATHDVSSVIRPSVQATLQPSASAMPAAVASAGWVAPPPGLSAEEQAIISRYLRPDVKATLFREPPPGAVPVPVTAMPEPLVVEPVAPVKPAAVHSLQPPLPSGPSPILTARVAATLPPGYQAPDEVSAAKPFAPVTGFAPLGILPDVGATLPRSSILCSAGEAPVILSPTSQPEDVPSPRALRASTIPPSTAVEPTAAAQKANVERFKSASTAPEAAPASEVSLDPVLLSTAKRGTRVIGASHDDLEPIDLNAAVTPRPQTSSIWSSTYPRPSVAYTMPSSLDAILPMPGIRAERIPVRAETVLVRRSRDGQPAAEPQQAQNGHLRPSVGFTLPPGALGDE